MATGDVLVDSRSNDQNLTFNELVSYLRCRAGVDADPNSRMMSAYLRNEDDEYNVLAQLLSDQNPVILAIHIFQGKDTMAMSHCEDFGGHSILMQTSDLGRFAEAINETSSVIENRCRIDTKMFDHEAFMEAWSNACVHNDWMHSMPPVVHVFDDRMEITSYVSEQNPPSEKEIFCGDSAPVNSSLMKLFYYTGLTHNNGSGMKKILGTYGKDAIMIADGKFKVTLKFTNERWSAGFRHVTSTDEQLA